MALSGVENVIKVAIDLSLLRNLKLCIESASQLKEDSGPFKPSVPLVVANGATRDKTSFGDQV